jgi:hypothetical protein
LLLFRQVLGQVFRRGQGSKKHGPVPEHASGFTFFMIRWRIHSWWVELPLSLCWPDLSRNGPIKTYSASALQRPIGLCKHLRPRPLCITSFDRLRLSILQGALPCWDVTRTDIEIIPPPLDIITAVDGTGGRPAKYPLSFSMPPFLLHNNPITLIKCRRKGLGVLSLRLQDKKPTGLGQCAPSIPAWDV